MRTQVDEGIVVLVGIVAYRIADAVGYIVLQPALFYGKHFIESIGNMEAYGIHLFVHYILLNLFCCQPTFVGKSVLQFIPVELSFFWT